MGSTHPTDLQLAFFDRLVLGRADVVYTQVHPTGKPAVNIKGPFRLQPYRFAGVDETVLEPTWAQPEGGHEESNVHVHIDWGEVLAARLVETNSAVRSNIGFMYSLQLLDGDDVRRFWFYVKDASHPAMDEMKIGDRVPII